MELVTIVDYQKQWLHKVVSKEQCLQRPIKAFLLHCLNDQCPTQRSILMINPKQNAPKPIEHFPRCLVYIHSKGR